MFKVVINFEDLIKVFIVRGIVFLEEQKVPYGIERDIYDYTSTHVLGEENGEPFGAGRIRKFGDYAKFERIAIRKSHRGKKLGHELIDFMISIAKEQGYKKVKIHAQTYLTEFYKKHGFAIAGEIFQEAGKEHYTMIRTNID
ncbi:MAG: GNAT family N-acetyltransferase [Candidatus Kuenenia sp.]|nr:GNAT family N-acetyltransferase [Candidatus Kuenenia hertensis]